MVAHSLIMNHPYRLFLKIILLLIVFSPVAQASYVDDGTLVILRSQFLESSSDISIDAVLNEEAWTKAGSLTLGYTQPDNVTITLYFTNSATDLFFAIVATELDDNDFDAILLTFDVEADGNLVSPEDAVSVNNASQVFNSYWNGEEWTQDSSSSSSEFEYGTTRANGKQILEIRKTLTPSNVGYDGFRIPNPSNTFISFNIRYVESQRDNDTVTPIIFDFPTSPTNSTGFVDLKLAGAEDQDLPEFIPPETFNPDPPASELTFDEAAGELASYTMSITALSLLTIMIVVKRRRQL